MSVNVDGDRVFKQSGTAPTATGVTVKSVGDMAHRVHKVSVAYTALTGNAGTTGDVTLWTTPPKTRVLRVIADVRVPFTGGSISACAMTGGRTAGGNQYLLSCDVFTAAAVFGDVVAEMGAGVVSATLADWQAAAQTIQARFTSSSDNLSALTAGLVDIYIETISYPAN